MTRLMLIDAHPLFGQAITLMAAEQSDWTLEAIVPNSLEALRHMRTHGLVDVVLIDRFPGGDCPDGLDLAALIRRRHPSVEVILLTQYIFPSLCERALAVGIHGLVAKHQAFPDLIEAVQTVCQGHPFGLSQGEGQTPISTLPPTQEAFMRALTENLDGPHIAARMSLRPATVHHLLRLMMDRFEVHSEQALRRCARQLFP